MRFRDVPVLVVCGLVLASCGSEGAQQSRAGLPTPADGIGARTTTPQPTGSGRTHLLHVTVRDLHADEAYTKDGRGRCVAFDPVETGNPEMTPSLIVNDVNGNRLATVRGPMAGDDATNDDWCSAQFTVEVPYRPKYQLSLASAARGIAPPGDAAPPIVVTKGTFQKVLFTY